MASDHESGLRRRRILECPLIVAIRFAPQFVAGNNARACENTFAQYYIPEDACDLPVTDRARCRPFVALLSEPRARTQQPIFGARMLRLPHPPPWIRPNRSTIQPLFSSGVEHWMEG